MNLILMSIPIILALALVIDLTLGEPPVFVHPVVWMGKVISFLMRGRRIRSQAGQFVYGILVVFITTGIFTAPAYFLLWYLKELNIIAFIIVAGLIFKTTFSLKGLWLTAIKTKHLLQDEKLAEVRFELRALVGRDTSKLDKSLMVSAVVESVAESSCDSFFAPLFYFVFLGIPGAVGYRVINTLDSMVGHHGEYEYLGKFAAWLDTAANFIPARIAALFIILASWICRFRTREAWHMMLRDHLKTKSPNAGWTMSAAAGAIGVQLEKVGYYKLGDNIKPLLLGTIDNSLKLVLTAAVTWSLLIIVVEVIYHVAT